MRICHPLCGSDAVEWQPASDPDTIYSYSVVHRAEVPYVIAYATLDEGVTMMTNLVDCNFDHLRTG